MTVFGAQSILALFDEGMVVGELVYRPVQSDSPRDLFPKLLDEIPARTKSPMKLPTITSASSPER